MIPTVLITGGASGIGAATARAFLARGFKVAIFDIDDDRGVPLIDSFDGPASYTSVDVTDPRAVRDAVEDVVRASGGLQHVVSCAGRALPGEFGELDAVDPGSWDATVRLNLSSHFYVVHATQEALQEGDGNRSVTFVSSINALQGYGLVGYSAAKAGLLGLTNALAPQMGRRGVRVNAVLPGTVRPSDPAKREPGKDYEAYARGIPLGRMAEEDDIAEAATSLALDLRHTNGAHLVVDGGQTVDRI